jgi:hypothetical protein
VKADALAVVQEGTLYSWHSMPTDGKTASDYPVSGICAVCFKPLIKRRLGDPWWHRPPGEIVAGPAETAF